MGTLKRSLSFVASGMLLTASLTGCAGVNRDAKSNSVNILEPQANFKFSDIPVPAGFSLLPLESYSFQSAGIRVGLLKYQGKAEADRVVNFYKEQMAMYNWSLINVIEYGQRLMNFEREGELCNISLLPKGSATQITIALGPKSTSPAKKAEKPVK